MQRRQTGFKIALPISLLLHIIALLSLRGVIVQTHVYKNIESIYVSLIAPLDFPAKPPRKISRRTTEPVIKKRAMPSGIQSRGLAEDKPPPRQVLTIDTDRSTPEKVIPLVDTKVQVDSSLSSPVSSTSSSASGAPSQGKGEGSGQGSGKGGRTIGGLASVSPRKETAIDATSLSGDFQVYAEADMPFIKALQEIAQHVVSSGNTKRADVVFIIDTSESMQDNIDAVRRHLSKMIERFQVFNLDFTLGVVTFHHSLVYEWLGMDIKITPQTTNVEEIERVLRSIKVSGGERALDALMKSISDVKFRPGVDRHFILVTDEYVSGTHAVSDVLKAAKRDKITIDVIGRDEAFQRTIAEQTGGIWTSIERIEGGK